MSGLAGRRVVITRSAEQSPELAGLVTAAGGVPVVVPLIEIVPIPVAWPALDGFDWIVVTSPNGAAQLGDVPPAVKTAAVGTATSDALARPADLVAVEQSAAGLTAVFPAGAGRVLTVQAADAAPTLADGLAAKGWDVEVLMPYRSVARMPGDDERGAAASADVLLLASGSAARAWAAAFGTRTPPVVVAIGPQCAQVARSVGLTVTVTAADHSLAGLVAAIPTDWARNHLEPG